MRPPAHKGSLPAYWRGWPRLVGDGWVNNTNRHLYLKKDDVDEIVSDDTNFKVRSYPGTIFGIDLYKYLNV